MILHGDCLEQMKKIESESVNLILTDPPYFRVKNEPWDKAWDSPEMFLRWLGTVADEWRRILAPNGSLYCFAYPQMAARVEVMLAERFTVLNHAVWVKSEGWFKKTKKSALRSYNPQTERVIFCEQFDADGSALKGSGYAGKCQELHAGVLEPLRKYLVNERDRAKITNRQVDEWLNTAGMAGHYFGSSQWYLPTENVYARLRELFNQQQNGEYLRREYKDLRREYEDLRRPFVVSKEVPSTDVWNYSTVYEKGKHSCQKPLPMMADIIRASSRSGDLVLDSFAGSGVVGIACVQLDRRFIGIELNEYWATAARDRIETAKRELRLFS